MNKRWPVVVMMICSVALALAASAPDPQGGAPGQPPEGRRGRGGGDQFAGQPRINALIVSGGCCHDYAGEAKVMMDAIGRALPIDWTVVVQGGRGTRGSMPVYASADWASRF